MASSDHSTNCANTSDEEDFSSNEESSSDSMETTKSAPGKLRPDELQILQDGLNDWKEADTNKRASLMEGMQNKIKWLDANKSLKQNEWNRKWTAVKNWMYNNSQSWAWKALIKYGSKWTALKVIKLQHKKDIQQVLVKAGIHPGTLAMIKHYQPAIQKVVRSLTKAELDQAAHLAKEWNERKPPPKAQAEVATIKGQKYAKQFAYDMWKQCGMRVVIMLAWKDKEGEVMVGVNDFNDKLGDGELYSDWEDLHGKWSAYTKKAFGANGMEDGSREDEASQTTVKAQKGKKQSQFSLSTNDDGMPILPNLLDLWTLELKDIMRVFITSHYCLACGKMNASVPWAAIADNQASYVSSKYLPPNILFKEPTRLTHHELIETLEWRSQDGSLEEPVSKHQHWSDKAKGKRPWTEINSIDGSNYGHHLEKEPAPPTKPSTKQQWIDGMLELVRFFTGNPNMTLELCAKDHPTGTSNAQEDNRRWNQSTSDWGNTATAYPKPADNHANDGGDSTARKPKPKPRIRSNDQFPCTLG
ncbi:hypothetical protein F5J12DRAFT_898544 [Pisolithus orientalis]|uniref:uncharacterized protein n=1 Tax=Pisolithus orientalis TaxID=936130 RepID=UPI0022255946|nr:uncharacterized protein F5J12DRAFT_898544 [Pisolithus orientalis]KAI5987343.1 hypothetical protein F5J12DRAFT_898544 [Pisolithus orientalis]